MIPNNCAAFSALYIYADHWEKSQPIRVDLGPMVVPNMNQVIQF